MGHKIKVPNKADVDVGTISGTESIACVGPPKSGNPNSRGIYQRQVAGANGEWRWVQDEQTPGVASPTTYTFLVV